MTRSVKVRHPDKAVSYGTILNEGQPDIEALRTECRDMKGWLLEREASPIDNGVASLMEVSSACYGRLIEIDTLLHEAESKGYVLKSSPLYNFRTRELRDMLDLSKHKFDLGSRRLTRAQFEFEQVKMGLG